jgi:hypothetical protein
MSKFVFRWDGDVPPMIQQLASNLSNPLAMGAWDRIKYWLAGIVAMMFRNRGGQYNRSTWDAISPSMYDKLRIGTDGAVHGRYGDRPNHPLRASGTYRKSFDEITKPRPTMMIWGSKHPLAALLPFVGLGRKNPRIAMPDQEDARFKRELVGHGKVFVQDAIRMARG